MLRLGSDRDRPLAALTQEPHDRFGQIVETERRRADAIPHADEPLENQLDVGMVAEGNGYQPDPAGVRPGGLGDFQDARRRKRPHRQIVVARPAEAAEVRAAPDDFNQQAGTELGIGREDAGAGRIEAIGVFSSWVTALMKLSCSSLRRISITRNTV